ncbi:hypothetical protein EDB81DRAFT_950369 [Dactylonectria macrodidyma]|uniref:Uncharacterized protein n=1 Tax=Dactylonectria macrodidyma TaxID=307937 RepID=A0A9P9E574_9HYPO|nr:hypothetical protein EDB81DRAFT_950369 [Dactylonectria macrodidyma]
MPATENAIRAPSTPERRLLEDFMFSTPTSGADINRKITALDWLYNTKDLDHPIRTPECGADIEEYLAIFKKHRDDYFDDLCTIMRKVGSTMDAKRAELIELRRKHAFLAEELDAYESTRDESDGFEGAGSSSHIPETANAGGEVDKQTTKPEPPAPAHNLRSRKRKTTTEEEADNSNAQKKKTGRAGRSQKK